MPEKNWKTRLFSIGILLTAGLLLFQLRDNIRYSFLRKPEALLPAQALLRSSPVLFHSTWAEAPSNLLLDYQHGTLLNPGNTSPLKAWPLPLGNGPTNRDEFLILVHPHQQAASSWAQPWRGRLRSLAHDPWRSKIVQYAQEHHWFDSTVDRQALQQDPTLAQATAWPTQEKKDLSVTGQQMISLAVLFPNEIRVLLPKNQYSTLQSANQAIQRLPFPHAPGVETATGFGYVVRLPESTDDLQHAWNQIRQTAWPYEAQRLEHYQFRRDQATWNASGWTLPGSHLLPQPTHYVLQQATQNLLPSSATSTFIPWSSIQSISLVLPIPAPENLWILHTDQSPAAMRLWMWPLLAGIIALMSFHIISLVRSVKRTPSAIVH